MKLKPGDSLPELSLLTDIKDDLPSIINLSNIIDLGNLNGIHKLLRVTAYILRFTKRRRNFGDITSDEIESARKKLWKISEQQLHAREQKTEFLKTKGSLRIFTEDEILRCGGRLTNSDLPYDSKHPIYLPRPSRLAKLLIEEAHDNVYHQKEKATLVEVRANYWIPQYRKLVRSLLKKCYLCKRLDSLSFSLPLSPPLPSIESKCHLHSPMLDLIIWAH